MTADVYLPINVTTHRIKAADVPKLLSDVEECSKGLRGFSGYNIDFVQESKSVSSWLVCPNNCLLKSANVIWILGSEQIFVTDCLEQN